LDDGLAARVTHALFFKPVSQVGCDVGWSVVGEQASRRSRGAWSKLKACRALFRVAVTSAAVIVVHRFQATM
jgi:hypothetical protein